MNWITELLFELGFEYFDKTDEKIKKTKDDLQKEVEWRYKDAKENINYKIKKMSSLGGIQAKTKDIAIAINNSATPEEYKENVIEIDDLILKRLSKNTPKDQQVIFDAALNPSLGKSMNSVMLSKDLHARSLLEEGGKEQLRSKSQRDEYKKINRNNPRVTFDDLPITSEYMKNRNDRLNNLPSDIPSLKEELDAKEQSASATKEVTESIEAAIVPTVDFSEEVQKCATAMEKAKEPLASLVQSAAPTMNMTAADGTSLNPLQTVTAATNEKGVVNADTLDGAKVEFSELDQVMTDFGNHSMGIFQDIARQGGMSAKSIGDSFKNLALSSFFNQVIPMMFGLPPGRATGGRVYGGQSYLVGEKGPEILTPDSAATITPRGAGMGSGGNTTQLTQHNHFTTDVKNTVRAEVLNAAPHIVNEAANAVHENMRRGHRYI